MEVATKNQGRIDLLDCDLVKSTNIDTHFYFKKHNINISKSQIIKDHMKLINPNVKINSF